MNPTESAPWRLPQTHGGPLSLDATGQPEKRSLDVNGDGEHDVRAIPFLVLPNIPERIRGLEILARNLYYSWNPDIVKLFTQLDADIWHKSGHNPVKTLASVSQETLQRAANDKIFIGNLERAVRQLSDYTNAPRWFADKFPTRAGDTIAYFSAEFGLDASLPMYSGGLGILSGDHLKAASDLGLPLVAMGLLYRSGYFQQSLSTDGAQQEKYTTNDWYNMPVQLVRDSAGAPVTTTIAVGLGSCKIQIWRAQVGLVSLYLLDTNLPENEPSLRDITSILYGGDKDLRIRQEIVLGIGGARALAAMGIPAKAFHINEGHSMFLVFERTRQLMQERRISYDDASAIVWSSTVFTTHTPVPAGNEQFEASLMERYLRPMADELGIAWPEMLAVGRIDPSNHDAPFSMTVAALKSAAYCNGVSKLHGAVTRKMWQSIWPGLPTPEAPISSVTNGVHPRTWISPRMWDLYQSYLGPAIEQSPQYAEEWANIFRIPDLELWQAHQRRREELVYFARERLASQAAARGASEPAIREARQALDPNILTVGFARRFSTYKRGSLILHDLGRLADLLNSADRPIQIIVAGKAHPKDDPGKAIIRQVYNAASLPRIRHRLVFLEDYDMTLARHLVSGCDIWLNNPRRPEEASGTSGMKACMNGCLHLSVLDGWWDEAYHPSLGWKIGSGEDYNGAAETDHLDAARLYELLESEIAPLFYSRDASGAPREWVSRMKKAISVSAAQYSSHRMVMEYCERFYDQSIAGFNRLTANNCQEAREVTNWKQTLKKSWGGLQILAVETPDPAVNLHVGDSITVNALVRLGDIPASYIGVEVLCGNLNNPTRLNEYAIIPASADATRPAESGTVWHKAVVPAGIAGQFSVTVRLIPRNQALAHTIRPHLLSWWRG